MADLKLGTAAYDKVIEEGGNTVQAAFAAAVAWDVPVAEAMDNLLRTGALELRQYTIKGRKGSLFLRFDRTDENPC